MAITRLVTLRMRLRTFFFSPPALRSHRLLKRRSTRHGDVLPLTPQRQCSQSSPPPLNPPSQDPGRDKKTPHQLNENGHRLAAYGDDALVKRSEVVL